MQLASLRRLAVAVAVVVSIAGLATIVGACGSTSSPPAAPTSAPAAANASGSELAVPFGNAPTIDGKVDDAEWAGAASSALGLGATLRFLHDGARVYVAVSGLTAEEVAFVCLFIAEPDQIRVLHASAKLGSAIYREDAGHRFQPQSKTYEWRTADALLRDEGWMGTTVGPDKPRAQELALTFAALGLPDQPRRFAVGYFHVSPSATDPSQAGALVWPAGLDDAVANVQLLGGFNPDDLQLDPSRWATLRPLPRR